MAIFHDEFHHGHVVHGHAARHILEKEKRDSHGSKPKMNVPREQDNKWKFIHMAGKDVEVETVYSQVYVTQSKTFDGPAEWVTETGTTPGEASATPSLNSAQASYAQAKSLANNPGAGTVGTPLQNSVPASTTAASETASRAAGTPLQNTPVNIAGNHGTETGGVKGTPIHDNVQDTAATPVKGTPLAATGNDSQPGLISEKSDGMSGGEKAGLAFGIIIALALVGGLIFFCLRRRKQQANKEGTEQLNEKHASANSFFGGTAAAFGAPAGDARGSVQSRSSTRTASTAPRLSLRPVTQFLPNIMENRKSGGAGAMLNVPQMSEKPKSGWERPAQNPFSDAAVLTEKQARPESPPSNPFDEGSAAVVAAGKATPTHSQNNSWDGNEPATPKSTSFGTASAVPIANGATAAGPRGPNNVHRVQLDFKPSMDDELGLKSGQLVRMLHEYDDGWALCIRMDRSQQGVCPRTCLSKLPVKPRPQGPPPNGPNGRPMGPPPNGRPMSPQMRGPPSGPNGSMYPRPLTPNGRERSASVGRQSPAPQQAGRPRSQSVSAASVERPVSPLTTGMPARKPVPGQAM